MLVTMADSPAKLAGVPRAEAATTAPASSSSSSSSHAPAPAPAVVPQPRVRSTSPWPRVIWAAGVFVLFTATVALSTFILSTSGGRVEVTVSLLLLIMLIISLLLLGGVTREVLHWRRPQRQLCRTLNDIRAGQVPMADLDHCQGGVEPVVEIVRAILFDLKDQKRIINEMREEMRTRIQNRTDALERQLGVMQAKAMRDALTALGNRAAFETMLPRTYGAAVDGNEDLSVLMIDIDNFKPLNDTLGHAAGDDLLRKIGEIIRSSIRDYDSAYRIGGDEFCILLPRCPRDPAVKLATRLGSLVDQLARTIKVPNPPRLSIGVASRSDARLPDAAALIALADKRLYEIKESRADQRVRRVA
jgi:diguanylate cyclase (GGDEF)-like protein